MMYPETYSLSPEQQLSYRSTSPGSVPFGHHQSTPNASYIDRSSIHPFNTTWERLQAGVDLSPDGQQSRNTSTGYSRLQSPSPERIFNRSRISPKDDHSSTSREYSDSTPRKNSVILDRVTHDDIHKSVLSYREKWQRSRRDRESLRLNRSSSEPNRQNTNTNNAQELRSRSYDLADRNRSILSHQSIDRYSTKSVTNGTYLDNSNAGSLRRDPVTHRKLPQPNGVARPIRDSNHNLHKSHISLARSQSTLSRGSRKVTLYGRNYGVHNSLVSMVACAVVSLILSLLSLQLLFRLNVREASERHSPDSVLQSPEAFHRVRAVAVTFSSASFTMNLCCLLTCSLQSFFAAKLIKCPRGEERAFKYLKECTGTRLVASYGLFLSIPVLILASMLYFVMEYPAIPAIIAVVIATIGVSFTLTTMVHSTFLWKLEKKKADNNFPPYSNEEMEKKKENMSHSEFSTLV